MGSPETLQSLPVSKAAYRLTLSAAPPAWREAATRGESASGRTLAPESVWPRERRSGRGCWACLPPQPRRRLGAFSHRAAGRAGPDLAYPQAGHLPGDRAAARYRAAGPRGGGIRARPAADPLLGDPGRARGGAALAGHARGTYPGGPLAPAAQAGPARPGRGRPQRAAGTAEGGAGPDRGGDQGGAARLPGFRRDPAGLAPGHHRRDVELPRRTNAETSRAESR